jgi:hypothetical protein
MSCIVTVAFDIPGVSHRDHEELYKEVYEALKAVGLERTLQVFKGKVILPESTVLGYFDGRSSRAVRDDIRAKVKKVFTDLGLKSSILVTVGEDGAWGTTAT